MSPVLRKNRPAGMFLRQHRKSRCVACDLKGGCGTVHLTPQELKRRKEQRHMISHATEEEKAQRLKKW